MEREGISMKKDDFTEEELKALYRDFLENDIEPAPDSVREAYRGELVPVDLVKASWS